MIRRLLITSIFAFMLIFNLQAQGWRDIKSVEDVCKAYPESVKNMINQFNLDLKGLEKAKAANETGDIVNTCKYILEYYEKGDNFAELRKTKPSITSQTDALADTILTDVFVIQNVRGQVPFGKDGHRDWYYKGPNNDHEWAWLSNRHSQIDHVYDIYLKTGNPKYAEYIDLFLRDFIIKSFPYPAVRSMTSVWRGLEVALRAKVWVKLFYGMLNNDYMSPATRLLMLTSFPDHAHYNRMFHAANNWLTMEISSLASVSAHFPEYKFSSEWLDYAIETMSASMKEQMYPDGVQSELTAHYHNVALANFEEFSDICKLAGKELPPYFTNTMIQMYDYIAKITRPDGLRPLNNDGDLGDNRDVILEGYRRYENPEWLYIATNGESGEKPEEYSFVFPWAGHLISRSGYDKDDQWSIFDMGPWGSGHQHNDKMHLSVAAYGRSLLVDAGRFAYTGEVARKFRKYANGTQSHNLILIDGNGQNPGPKLADEPVSSKTYEITKDYDYAYASFDDFASVEGECKHTRQLYYDRGNMWIVVDHIESDRPRKIDALWHFHPSCSVVKGQNRVFTANERGNLAVVSVTDHNWDISMVKGAEEPEVQGWYSQEYNIFEPNVTADYSTTIEGDTKIVWLLYPSLKSAQNLTATIVSDKEEGLTIKVSEGGYSRIVTIPSL